MHEYKYVSIDGNKIAYKRMGQGPPLVLIHGITTYSFLWERMFPLLAEFFDVIAPDLLGCGSSDKPPDTDYSIDAQAVMIKGLLDALDIEKTHILSHDIGGGVAQILAVNYPEMFITITLTNTVGYDYWPVQPIITMRIPFIRQIAMAALDMGIFRSLVRQGFYHKDLVTEELMSKYRIPLMTKDGREGFLQLAHCLDNNQLMAIADKLKLLEMPVLIVRGEADVYLKPIISARLHKDIPRSRLLSIPTAGHYSPLEEPEAIARAVIEFTGVKHLAHHA